VSNPFADAIKAGNYATIWVCTDCIHLHCNGEYDPDRPADLPEPLSQIPATADLSAGMLLEHHAPDHNPDECSCEFDPFSTRACDGCGDYHHGERYAMTLVYDQRGANNGDETTPTGSTSETVSPEAGTAADVDDAGGM
jgi:hypothetical protein